MVDFLGPFGQRDRGIAVCELAQNHQRGRNLGTSEPSVALLLDHEFGMEETNHELLQGVRVGTGTPTGRRDVGNSTASPQEPPRQEPRG